ncbi:hypothetical protein BLA50215_02143 [Burkholderia lata]|nr:hypothetical protein BLA50215_02143 [Burkholderia lata]
MLHACEAGSACAQTHVRGRYGCPAAACNGHSSVQAVADIGLSCAEAVPSATVISRGGGDCGFCVKDCKTPSHKPASLSRIDTPRMHTPAGNCRCGGVAVRAGRAVKCGQGRRVFGQARPLAIARCGFVRNHGGQHVELDQPLGYATRPHAGKNRCVDARDGAHGTVRCRTARHRREITSGLLAHTCVIPRGGAEAGHRSVGDLACSATPRPRFHSTKHGPTSRRQHLMHLLHPVAAHGARSLAARIGVPRL